MLYDGTACSQKTENAKSTVSSITYGAFTIPPSTLCVATSLYTREAVSG
ncbi:hypothetical protein [uncultured Eubacterium sp.]|nr:hypothetical protein [uncultured Eubacterium sp.]